MFHMENLKFPTSSYEEEFFKINFNNIFCLMQYIHTSFSTCNQYKQYINEIVYICFFMPMWYHQSYDYWLLLQN